MKKLICFLTVILVFLVANNCDAAGVFSDTTGDHDWFNAANWDDGVFPPSGTNANTYVVSCTAIIDNDYSAATYFIGAWVTTQPAYLVIDPNVDITGWWKCGIGNTTAGAAGTLTLLAGSTFTMEDATDIGGSAAGLLDIQGGTYSCILGTYGAGATVIAANGEVKVTDGVFETAVLSMVAGAHIDLSGTGIMKIVGDETYTGSNLMNYITDGWITSNNRTGTVVASYDSGYTIVSVPIIHIPFCSDRPTFDFTDDCVVNIADFAIFAGQWLKCGFEDPVDCPQ